MRPCFRVSLLHLTAFAFLIAPVLARTTFATSPDYIVTTSTGASIVPGTTDVGNHCDDCMTNDIALPFPVIFYDQVFTTFDVSSDGHLTFTSANDGDYNFCLPRNSISYLIVPGSDDLFTTDGGDGQGVFTSVSGSAPNRIFNIEWRTQVCCANSPPNGNFEVRLYEGQRRIDFIYGNSARAFNSIGVQRDTGSQSTIVTSCGGGTPASGTQYTFTIPDTCVPPPPNMVAWWRGDGNADDSVGGHHGSLLGGASFASGEVDQAFSLDGTGAHIAVGDVDVPATFTIDAWINPTDLSSNPRIFSKDDDTTVRSYELRVTAAGYLEATVNSPSQTFYATNTSPIVTGSFQHVAVTYDGNASAGEKLKFYVNGVNIPASPVIGNDAGGTPSNTSVAALIGIAGNRQTGPFSGLIDEVEVFDRVLSSAEIEGIYIAGSAGKCKCTPPPDNMISWWPGEGDGNDIQDGNTVSAGNGNGFGFGAGEVGSAFTFDGSQFATAGTPSNLTITTEHVTIDGWINPSVSPSGFTLLFGHALSGGHDYALILDTDLTGVIKTANGDPGLEHFVHTGYNPPLNTWTHVALTYDGSTITVYANGVVVGAESKTGSISNSGGPFNIGGRVDCCFYTGAIDEVEVFDRTLSPQEIALIYNAGSAGKCRPCTPPPTGMAGWWPGEGNLTDIQGGHNGTGSGGGPSFAGGEVGQAMDFDGVDDFFTAANVPDPNKAFTFDAWVYWRGPTGSGQQNLVEKLDGIGGASYLLGIADNGVLVSVIGGNVSGGLAFNTNQTVPVNQWTHIVETDDGSTVSIYINGQLDTSVTADRNTSSDLLYFGSTGSQFFLNGEMDEIEIYSRGLSQSEIQAIYDAGSGGKCKPAIPAARHLVNISTRASVGTGDNVAIGGFILRDDPVGPRPNGGLPKSVLIRALGPSLNVNGTPVPGRLADTVLELHDFNGDLITLNDDWGDAANASDVTATGLAPADSHESAILITLQSASTYTAILRGANDTTGIGLIEVYDLEPTGDSHLVNISTRGQVLTGDDVLIGGIIVQGGTPVRVMVRALGPSLTVLGVANALADPILELHDGDGALIASNDDWGSSPDMAAITATGLNPNNGKESAILFVPAPGVYTAIVRGLGLTPTGVGMVEAYRLGPP